MTNGKSYHILMAPSAHRRYKKFDALLKLRVREEVRKLAKEPYHYRELKGPLSNMKANNIGLLIRFLRIRIKL